MSFIKKTATEIYFTITLPAGMVNLHKHKTLLRILPEDVF